MVKFKKKKDPKTEDPAKGVMKEPLVGSVKKKNKKLMPKQSTNDASKEADADEALTLDILKQLGGDEEDLRMVEDIKGSDNAEDISTEAENELKLLLKSLNFKKFRPEDFVVKDADVTESDGNPTEAKDEAKKSPIEEVKKEEVKEEIKEEAEEENLLPDSVTKRGSEFHFLKEPASRKHSVIKTSEGSKWYEVVSSCPASTQLEMQRNKYWLPKLEKYTAAAMEMEIENYKASSMKGARKSERQWLETVLKSGTMTDKMSAYLVVMQESPLHHASVLDTLISLVSLKSRRPCLLAIDTLKDLFLNVLLPPDRKLRSFEWQPFQELTTLSGGNKDTRDRYLMVWAWEEKLKRSYNSFLEALDMVARDTVEKTKLKALATVAELLGGHPEQEASLLERLVNKLGDPARSVAAKAMYQLTGLLEKHPAMRMVVVTEVERLLYRQNINPKAQYYGICFLSTIILDRTNSDELAARLITIYFSFFKVSVTKGEVDTKLMKALLTGVNRAFPYASLAPGTLEEQLGTMHKLVHMVSFNTAIQALTLLHQVMEGREAVTDRFYTALYRKILDPALSSSSKQVMFLNLLFKAIKADPSEERIRAFIKRLLQVAEAQPSQLLCGLLFLLSEVLKARPELGNLCNFLKEEAGGVQKFKDEDDDDDDEEHYEDVKEEDADPEEAQDAENTKVKKEDAAVVAPGWTFKGAAGSSSAHSERNCYDPTARNPLYCGAGRTALWELERLSNHFHPSAALFASNLLAGQSISYSGDPLGDFTLARFLDRFVFRNPKQNPEKNKPLIVLGKRNIYRPSGIKAVAPDSVDFRNRDLENVPKDEMFLYKYFNEKVERKGEKVEDDKVSVTSEEFNDYLDKMGGGRQADFDDEDIDFAGGLEEENARKRKAGDDDDEDAEEDAGEDEDMEGGVEDNEEDEPMLEGEDDAGFKELESDGEENGDFDEEGFGGADSDDFDEEGFGEEEEDS